MGVRVGQIDKIEPAGDKMKVTFHYDNKYKVPANATASILNPSLVASRTIQLSPPYTGGPVMEDDAVIPLDRTQVPVEYDELRDSLNRILTDLGPDARNSPRARSATSSSPSPTASQGKGEQINKTLNGLSEALTTLNKGRGDFFGVVTQVIGPANTSSCVSIASGRALAVLPELAPAASSVPSRSFTRPEASVIAEDFSDIHVAIPLGRAIENRSGRPLVPFAKGRCSACCGGPATTGVARARFCTGAAEHVDKP